MHGRFYDHIAYDLAPENANACCLGSEVGSIVWRENGIDHGAAGLACFDFYFFYLFNYLIQMNSDAMAYSRYSTLEKNRRNYIFYV